MVRPRVQLERLDGDLSREHFYLQTRATITKKVKEMSILTASDILFLSFSPSGIPSICLGDNTNFLNVVTRFSEISFHNREKRRLDNLNTMRVNYQKDEYNIDVETLHKGWHVLCDLEVMRKYRRLVALNEESRRLKDRFSSLNHKRSLWENPGNINSIESIKEMERTILKSIELVSKRKEELKAQEALRSQDEVNVSRNRVQENPEEIPKNHAPQPHVFDDYLLEMFPRDDNLLEYAKMFSAGCETVFGDLP